VREQLQYVVLLPVTFNDGSVIPESLHLKTHDDLFQQFGGLTVDGTVAGSWESQGIRYDDQLWRVLVAGDDTDDNERFMREFKERLKARFEQEEIWIEVHRIRLL
jgi:hypothetical protein